MGCLLVVLPIAIPSRACVGKLSMIDCFIGACAWRCNSTAVQADGEARPSMSVQVVRTDPLMLAVDNFLSEDEIATVVRHGSPLLSRSGIQEASAVEGTSSELRTSQVRNRIFGDAILYPKVIILPRQARDKHRENSKNERRFLLQTAFLGDHLAFEPALIALQKRAAAFSGGLGWTHSECMQLVSYRPGQQFATHTVRKTPSFEHFYNKK